ncbi:hypothetical protein [Ensifer adhaerens]|uniref:hypothetical protein n=1 Tax=Ensifer adhaerens TaxID=106592 RepID=UPI001F265183|nr:hypothetical protein [Ensifer adhaerens]
MAYVVVYRYYHLKFFRDAGKGRPDIEWMLRGLREYDPTKDSTVAGGNGPQRLNDRSTWVHTLNPAVHRLNYQLGLRGLLSGRTLVGEGKSLGQLDLSSYFVAINYCRTLRNGKPIYQCSLWVSAETDHTEALQAFDDAMAGYGLNRRGLSGVVVGAPQIPVLTITDADIPADRPKPRQPRKSAFELYNHLSGQFTSPDSMWNPESLKPIVVNADVAADKRARQTSIDFLQVHDADIAQYLLNVRYRQNRKGGTATVPVSRRVGLKAVEGEWVTWLGKSWMISDWHCNEDLRFSFELSETGADIYDDGDIAPGPIVLPPTPPINPSMLSVVQGFNVAAGIIAGASGSQMPCLKFTWTPPADPTIVSVNITYEVVGGDQRFSDVSTDPESGEKLTTDNVVSGKVYRAKATITTTPDRFRTETPWVTATIPTGNMNVLDNSITAAKIAEAAVTADKIMNEAITSLKLANQAVTTAKLQVAAVTSDILASQAVISSKLADAAVTAQKLAAEAVDATKFASGIKPVEVVSALPTTGNSEGRQAYLTTDGKVYRYRNGRWVKDTAAADITGQLVSDQLADALITNSKLAALAVDAAKLATNAVTETKIADNAITTPKLVANAVVSDKIATNAITARTLLLADLENLIPNGNIEDISPIGTYWGSVAGGGVIGYLSKAAYPDLVLSGTRSIILQKPAGDLNVSVFVDSNAATLFPVTAGEILYGETTIKTNGPPASAGAYYRVLWFDADQTIIPGSDGVGYGDIMANAPMTAAWVTYSRKITVPANAAFGRVRLYNHVTQTTTQNVIFDRLILRRANAANLIVDGSLTATMIAASAITADKLAANSVVAGKIAAGAVSADQIAANAIISSKIAAGAITADKLAVGTGANYIENSDFFAGTATWGARWSNAPSYFTYEMRTDTYGVSGGSLQIRHARLNAGDAFDIAPWDLSQGTSKRYPVEAGKRYQFSAYLYSHRASRVIYIGWFDASGNNIAYAQSAVAAPENGNPVSLLSNYNRLNLFATAPANAASCEVFIRHTGTAAGGDSYLWVKNAFFGEATANQTEPSPWSPSGTTMISGGHVLTGAITSDKIAALAITAGKIAAGAVTATELAAGSVTAIKIAAAAITGDKIAANTIGANNIAANAITAKHLVLTDYENLVANGYWSEGNVILPYWAGSGGTNLHMTTSYSQTGQFALVLQKTNVNASVYMELQAAYAIAVTGGEQLYGEISAMTNGQSASAGLYFRILWYDASKTGYIGYTDMVSNAPVGNGFETRSGRATAPANARYATLQVYNHSSNTVTQNFIIDRIVLRRMKAANLIVDGSITADKLNVTSLSAISASFGDAYFSGVARSINGKLLLDFNNGGIEVST